MTEFPADLFRRVDESPDREFYREPRFVTHIDDATIDALTRYYQEFIPEQASVLDLMSSWISHLPDVGYSKVVGLGMNADELAANPRLDEFLVHDLNETPELPYAPESFDRVLITVSIQYLVRPVDVLASTRRVLKRRGRIAIAMSHRLFPTKATVAFTRLPAPEFIRLVQAYLHESGYSEVEFVDRSPASADPLWLITGMK
ncbi:MAG: class I SAM-dependent methyltransferase [Pseudomonadales bacterium]